MHFTAYLLLLSLTWKFMSAEICYQCAQRVEESDDIAADSCAGGDFYGDKIPMSEHNTDSNNGKLIKRDCGTSKCFKAIAEFKSKGYTAYVRACSDEIPGTEGITDECAEGPTPGDSHIPPGSYEACICSGDLCNGTTKQSNGTVKLNTQQAILGVIVSVVMTIVAMS